MRHTNESSINKINKFDTKWAVFALLVEQYRKNYLFIHLQCKILWDVSRLDYILHLCIVLLNPKKSKTISRLMSIQSARLFTLKLEANVLDQTVRAHLQVKKSISRMPMQIYCIGWESRVDYMLKYFDIHRLA